MQLHTSWVKGSVEYMQHLWRVRERKDFNLVHENSNNSNSEHTHKEANNVNNIGFSAFISATDRVRQDSCFKISNSTAYPAKTA